MVKKIKINVKANGQKLALKQGCHKFAADDEFEFVNPMDEPVTVTFTAVPCQITVPFKAPFPVQVVVPCSVKPISGNGKYIPGKSKLIPLRGVFVFPSLTLKYTVAPGKSPNDKCDVEVSAQANDKCDVDVSAQANDNCGEWGSGQASGSIIIDP